jgi:hypothetical protein
MVRIFLFTTVIKKSSGVHAGSGAKDTIDSVPRIEATKVMNV